MESHYCPPCGRTHAFKDVGHGRLEGRIMAGGRLWFCGKVLYRRDPLREVLLAAQVIREVDRA